MRLTGAQIAEYDERGYLFFPSLFSTAEIAELRAALPGLLARSGPEVVPEEADASRAKIVFGVHRFDEGFRRLTLHPRLLVPSEQILRSEVCIYQARLNPKAGFSGGGWGWHQDFNQWQRFDGMQKPDALMVAVFLDDVDACNAPLMVIPGSHKRGHVPVPDAMELGLETVREMAEAGGVEALMGPAGSVAFLSCILAHGSTGNLSHRPRCLFYVNYNSVENRDLTKPRDPYRCGMDFTPLRPLADGCLLPPEGPAAIPAAPPDGA